MASTINTWLNQLKKQVLAFWKEVNKSCDLEILIFVSKVVTKEKRLGWIELTMKDQTRFFIHSSCVLFYAEDVK